MELERLGGTLRDRGFMPLVRKRGEKVHEELLVNPLELSYKDFMLSRTHVKYSYIDEHQDDVNGGTMRTSMEYFSLDIDKCMDALKDLYVEVPYLEPHEVYILCWYFCISEWNPKSLSVDDRILVSSLTHEELLELMRDAAYPMRSDRVDERVKYLFSAVTGYILQEPDIPLDFMSTTYPTPPMAPSHVYLYAKCISESLGISVEEYNPYLLVSYAKALPPYSTHVEAYREVEGICKEILAEVARGRGGALPEPKEDASLAHLLRDAADRTGYVSLPEDLDVSGEEDSTTTHGFLLSSGRDGILFLFMTYVLSTYFLHIIRNGDTEAPPLYIRDDEDFFLNLSMYTDRELMEAYGVEPLLSSLSIREDIRQGVALSTDPDGSARDAASSGWWTVNSTSRPRPQDGVVYISYGNFHGYRNFTTEELLGALPTDKDGLLRAMTAYVETQGRKIVNAREARKNGMSATSIASVYPQILSPGGSFRKLYRKLAKSTLEDEDTVKSIEDVTRRYISLPPKDREEFLRYMLWSFFCSIYLLGWKGPGYPWSPLDPFPEMEGRRGISGDSVQRGAAPTRQKREAMDMINRMLPRRDVVSTLKSVMTYKFSWRTGMVRVSTTSLLRTMDDVFSSDDENPSYLQDFLQDVSGTAYYVVCALLSINPTKDIEVFCTRMSEHYGNLLEIVADIADVLIDPSTSQSNLYQEYRNFLAIWGRDYTTYEAQVEKDRLLYIVANITPADELSNYITEDMPAAFMELPDVEPENLGERIYGVDDVSEDDSYDDDIDGTRISNITGETTFAEEYMWESEAAVEYVPLSDTLYVL